MFKKPNKVNKAQKSDVITPSANKNLLARISSSQEQYELTDTGVRNSYNFFSREKMQAKLKSKCKTITEAEIIKLLEKKVSMG